MIINLFPKWAEDELCRQRKMIDILERVQGSDLSNYTVGITQMIALRKEIVWVIERNINDKFPVVTPVTHSVSIAHPSKESPSFTEEEIKTAMAIRDEIIRDDILVLKSIYMAGEIAMWASFKIK